jgi:hypothetical protein
MITSQKIQAQAANGGGFHPIGMHSSFAKLLRNTIGIASNLNPDLVDDITTP